MKIAVFHNFPPGGGKRTVYEQVKLLLPRHQVEVYELSNPEANFLDLRSLGCPVHTYPFTKDNNWPGVLSRLNADFRNFVILDFLHRRIAADIDRGRFDVAIIHPDKFTESPYILKYLHTPHVYHCHELLRIGYEPELAFTEPVSLPKRIYELATRKLRVAIDKTNARHARKIITNSKFIQAKIKSAYGRESEICYCGVDPAVFKPLLPKRNRIVFMGQRNHIGGYDFVTHVLDLIPDSLRPELLVYGFPKGLPDVSNDRLLAESYSSSLATICASISEPFGLKALESMSCGTPVLAVAEGGYRETVIEGKTGWLLSRDPHLFAKKIVDLVAHPQISEKMGQYSRKYIISHWTWQRHVKQLEHILSQSI